MLRAARQLFKQDKTPQAARRSSGHYPATHKANWPIPRKSWGFGPSSPDLHHPADVELHDNRLMPLASRDYTFSYRFPKDIAGLKLTARVRYHIQSERQHQMLIAKYGLTAPDPYFFTVYEQAVPLTGNLAAHFEQTPTASPMAYAAPPSRLKKIS